MKRFMPLIVVLAILAAGSWSWAQDSIKIGVVGPRTGPAAATGKAFEEGIAIALDHINAKGGVNGKKIVVTRKRGDTIEFEANAPSPPAV